MTSVVCLRHLNYRRRHFDVTCKLYHGSYLYFTFILEKTITEIVNPDRNHLLNRDSYTGLVCSFFAFTLVVDPR